MRQRLTVAGRFALAVLVIAALFAIAGAEPARHLPMPLALLFWAISVGIGLALAVGAAALLGRWGGTRRLARWQVLGLAGVVGLLLYAPLSLGVEAMFPAEDASPPDDGWLDRLEASGGVGALMAEVLQAGPLYLLTWALLNASPAAAFAPVGLVAPGPKPASEPPFPPSTPKGDAAELAAEAPASEPGNETARKLPVLPPEAPEVPQPSSGRAAEALGWPAALGDEVLCVTADLHYLHVHTRLGRATVLGSLAAVEQHFGAAGLRIHRSHWVARRAIRRVARSAGGWRCELHDGQRLPISRRRVAEVRTLLGADFVLEEP